MLSVIIPAYREPYLGKTIESLLTNAHGEIEVLPVLDGWQPQEELPKDKRVKPIYLSENKGKRTAVNAGVAKSEGQTIMMLDAHCIVSEGFDKLLCEQMAEDWLVVPRRYSLDPAKWEKDNSRPMVDYHHLSFPVTNAWGFGMYARQWDLMTLKRKDKNQYTIDDCMTIQASCWVANKNYFVKHIYPLDTYHYGPLAQDQQELALKYWLGGGKVKVNKNTWYAHVSKRWYHYSQGLFSRRHKKDKPYQKGNTWGTWHWLNNEEPNMTHHLSWLIEKFAPVPEWPKDWEKQIALLNKNHAA